MNPWFFTGPGMVLLLSSCWVMNYRPQWTVLRNWLGIAGGSMFGAGAVIYHDPFFAMMEVVFLSFNIDGLRKIYREKRQLVGYIEDTEVDTHDGSSKENLGNG